MRRLFLISVLFLSNCGFMNRIKHIDRPEPIPVQKETNIDRVTNSKLDKIVDKNCVTNVVSEDKK